MFYGLAVHFMAEAYQARIRGLQQARLRFSRFILRVVLAIHLFIASVFCTYVTADTTLEAENRLRSIDTSSPQAVVSSINRGMQEIGDSIAKKDYDALRTRVLQTIRIFDFSDTPPALVNQKGPEHLAQLIDILDRLPEINLDDIPDAKKASDDGVVRWRYPNTEITIHKVVEGAHAGEFLISPETFWRIPDYYDKVSDLPKRHNAIVPMELYQAYRNGAGTVFPVAVISKLPNSLRQDWFGQPGWKWPVLLSSMGLILLLAWPFIRLRPRDSERSHDYKSGIYTALRRLALPIYVLIAMQALDYLASRQLRLTGMGHTVVEVFMQLISLVAIAYILNLLIALLAEGVIKILHTRRAGFDSQLIRLAFRIIFWVITIMVIMVISEYVGVPVAALAAGVGVGGLAFALAAQSTLENLVAGLTIYGDRPIRVGDFCIIGGVSGVVENIGLRSTRLRTLERTLITIPNAQVAKQSLENISVRDKMLLQTTISLRYETSPNQLRYVLGRLRELFYGHPRVIDDGMRVRFTGFGASSLDIEIYLYVKATAKPAFLEICEDLNLRIMDIIEGAGAGFAFPSQTTYLARDAAPDPELVRAAEAHVESWREAGELPFPDLSDEAQDAVGDLLDYPPKGSPGNRRGGKD